MRDPLIIMILHGSGRDPRECRSEAELRRVLATMAASTREVQEHANRMFDGVPAIMAGLKRSIAFAQLDRLRALAR